MAENERVPEYDSRDCFKEAVCIDAMRVYDSCSEIHYTGYKNITIMENPL